MAIEKFVSIFGEGGVVVLGEHIKQPMLHGLRAWWRLYVAYSHPEFRI